jgi:hypothetical protein
VHPELRRFLIHTTSQVRAPGASQVPNCRIWRELYILKQVEKFEHKGLTRLLLSCFWFKDLRNTQNILRFLYTTTLANSFHEFRQSGVSRVRFTMSPNTSPSGKQVDSDDPFPQKLSNFGKKCHPQNVGVDTCPPENSQRSNRGNFLKLPASPL